MSTVSISILALVTNLCGQTNENLCHNNLMRCFDKKKSEEAVYAERLSKRSAAIYPEENLVFECAMDQGIDFVVPTEPESDHNSTIEPETAPMPTPDKYGMVWEDEIPGKMDI